MLPAKNNYPYNIILADSPKAKVLLPECPEPNMGILYLSSYAKHIFGEKIRTIYLETLLPIEEHIREIKKNQPAIYGISFTSLYAQAALSTIQTIRAQFPDLLIVAGGPHPTVLPQECLSAGADLVVLGEGEITFSEIIEKYCFKGEKNFSDIDGVAFINNGEVRLTTKRKLIENLNSLPFPDRDICKGKKFTGPAKVKKLPYCRMVVSRGCPYDCNFCSNPVWKYNNPWLRLRSPENIAGEIKYLYDLGYREITLSCDEFNSDLSWAKDVCNTIADLKIKDLYFNTLIRANPIDADFCDALKRMNCYSVNIGIESANERVLKGIGKYIKIDEVVNACELLRKNKIRVFGFFMILNIWEEDGVLKFETKDEIYNTLRFAKTLLKKNLLTNISWGFVSPTPGSRLYRSCKQHNLVDKKPYLVSKYDRPTINISDISDKELKKIKRYGYLLQAFYTIKNELSLLNFKNLPRILSRVKNLIK